MPLIRLKIKLDFSTTFSPAAVKDTPWTVRFNSGTPNSFSKFLIAVESADLDKKSLSAALLMDLYFAISCK